MSRYGAVVAQRRRDAANLVPALQGFAQGRTSFSSYAVNMLAMRCMRPRGSCILS